MKTMEKYIWMAAIAMTAATFTACSGEDLATDEKPKQKNNIVTLTATLSPKGGNATTRTLTDPGDGTISSVWAVDEELLVSYQKTDDSYDYVKVKVSSIDGNGNAVVTLNLDDPRNGSDINFNYPYSSAAVEKDYYYDQLGTLADISQNYDLCHGDGTLNVDGGVATLAGKVTMTRNSFIWKFTFTDGSSDITNKITSLVIDDGGGCPYTVSPSGQSVIYVAMTSNGTDPVPVTITAATGEGIFTKSVDGVTLLNGKLYTSNSVALTAVAAVDLSSKTADYTANSGDVLTGTLDPNYKLVIPMDAVVMLKNATIAYGGYDGAAITCEGNATIVIADGTTNSVTVPGGNDPDMSGYPGIQPGAMGTRLTIKGGPKGNGTLSVVGGYIAAGIGCTNSSYNGHTYGDDSGDYCGVIQIDGGVITVSGGEAGIGSVMGGGADNCEGIIINGGNVTATGGTAGIGSSANCEFIIINGGTVNANGTQDGPGIGAGPYAACGPITINGGTVTATGGGDAAGIGSGAGTSTYTSLTIANGITKVTATRGGNGTAEPIGHGKDDTTSPNPVFSGVTKDDVNSTESIWIYE
jgi:hypothetical protein